MTVSTAFNLTSGCLANKDVAMPSAGTELYPGWLVEACIPVFMAINGFFLLNFPELGASAASLILEHRIFKHGWCVPATPTPSHICDTVMPFVMRNPG